MSTKTVGSASPSPSAAGVADDSEFALRVAFPGAGGRSPLVMVGEVSMDGLTGGCAAVAIGAGERSGSGDCAVDTDLHG